MAVMRIDINSKRPLSPIAAYRRARAAYFRSAYSGNARRETRAYARLEETRWVLIQADINPWQVDEDDGTFFTPNFETRWQWMPSRGAR
jgi:hypothetical protein